MSLFQPVASYHLLLLLLPFWCRGQTKHHDEKRESIEKDQIARPLIWERLRKFRFGDIVKATEDFSENYCIGKGGFRTVYKVALPMGQIVAVKRLNMLRLQRPSSKQIGRVLRMKSSLWQKLSTGISLNFMGSIPGMDSCTWSVTT